MDLTKLAPWPITPRSAEHIQTGLNNESYFVEADEGQYVVRINRNTADPNRVRYEHELLGRLALHDLPFAVPSAVNTRDGDTLAIVESEDGPLLATLFRRIPGSPAQPSATNARLAGRALAQLDRALAQVELPIREPAELRDVHPLVPDPVAALDELDLGADHERIAELFERVDGEHATLAASLPLQIVHGDFAFPNVLIEDGVLTGFLDFEFAGPGVRAADLACAIYIIVVRTDEAERWRFIEALVSGYRRSLQLDPSEAAAIPALLMRRSADGLVHWIGRLRRGLTTRDDVFGRVERNAILMNWLRDNDARLALTVMGQAKARTP